MADIDLKLLHEQISETISTLDFDAIWEGFKPLKFALYNADECFFDGEYVEKTDEFYANTSIEYKGERIAIWNVESVMDMPNFASKIVHEMFHGFQVLEGWDCYADERGALCKYRYDSENLSIKLLENRLLLELCEKFERDKYDELMACRRYRRHKFPYEFSYESKVEEIEGTANFVEWEVLEQLDKKKAAELFKNMQNVMTKPEYFFPIRISCYYTGALAIRAMQGAGEYSFTPGMRPTIETVLREDSSDIETPVVEKDMAAAVEKAISDFNAESKRIVESAVRRGEVVLSGEYLLASPNIYDARFYNGYITSRFFLAYMDKEEFKNLYGNFVVKMKDDKYIETVYKWCEEE